MCMCLSCLLGKGVMCPLSLSLSLQILGVSSIRGNNNNKQSERPLLATTSSFHCIALMCHSDSTTACTASSGPMRDANCICIRILFLSLSLSLSPFLSSAHHSVLCIIPCCSQLYAALSHTLNYPLSLSLSLSLFLLSTVLRASVDVITCIFLRGEVDCT